MQDKKQQIYNAGKILFSEKGFKDTNVAEITKKAGMATGTFYNYYASKDHLFMEIFLDENIKLKQDIMATLDMNSEPLKVINDLMQKNLEGMMKNPILIEWYNRDSFQKIEQAYRKEVGLKYLNFMYDSFIDVVRKWQKEGIFRNDIDAEVIMAIFAAIINIDTHKDEIGLQFFPQVLEYISEFVIKGLMES